MTGDEVLDEIRTERARQIGEHGWTPEHDDHHKLPEWAWLLLRRVTELAAPFDAMPVATTRRTLLEVAAISVAAIEAHDRAHPPAGRCPRAGLALDRVLGEYVTGTAGEPASHAWCSGCRRDVEVSAANGEGLLVFHEHEVE